MPRARLLAGLIAVLLPLGFSPALHGQDKAAKANILAIAEDGSTWVAGEVKFKLTKDGVLDVSVDLATGVPDARVTLQTSTAPADVLEYPILRLLLTDKHGDWKYTESYGVRTPGPLTVWVDIGVEGAAVKLTSQREPVLIGR